MIVILFILKSLYLVVTYTLEVPLHLCFASLKGASEISLYHIYTPCSLQIYLMFQFHIVKLLVFCDFLMRQLNYYRIIVSVSFCHVTMKKSYIVNSMSPQKLFLLSFTYSRTSRN